MTPATTSARTDAGLVSIVVPCFNPGPYVVQALASALEQSYSPVEVIVVDDGSTEDVKGWIPDRPSVRYLRQPNLGVSAARNRGAGESRGDFLVFLDADDRLLPDAVRDGLQELSSNAEAAFAAGLCYPIGPAGEPLAFRQQPEVRRHPYVEMLEQNFIWMPAQVIYRRAAFEASGGFDTRLNACADYDLYLRIARVRPIVCHRRLVAEYRFHGGNMSDNNALMLSTALQTLNRQWPHVRSHPEYRRAYWTGWRFWQQFYGSRLVHDIRTGIKTPHRRYQALRWAATLLRHHPFEAFRQLGRKLRCMVLDLAGNTR